ncbi:MAG: signal peptidase II [Patescibacteria group bacterium]|jgi:signal peptidase II
MKTISKLLWLTIGGGLLVWADQATKGLIWSIEPSGWWTHHQNYGISFGIELPYYLSVGLMAVFLIFLLWVLFQRGTCHPLMVMGLALSIAGGLSNLIDRINLGFVRDFVALSPWLPIFNLADILVAGGVILMLWSIYRYGRS